MQLHNLSRRYFSSRSLALAAPILGIALLPVELSSADAHAQAELHIQVTVVDAVPSPTPLKLTPTDVNSVTLPTPTLDVKIDRHKLAPEPLSLPDKEQRENFEAVLETVTVVAQ